MKIGIIIQARMSSSRLPGKVSLPIDDNETPLLGFLIKRLKPVNIPIIVATSTQEDDNKVEDIAQSFGALVYRGSLNDVLGRYISAAEQFELDGVIRVTADNPFTTLESIRDSIQYLENEYDYVVTGWYYGYFPGTSVEGISYKALKDASKNATRDSDREHVTPYIKRHPEKYKTVYVRANPNRLYFLTVDYKEDLESIRKLTSSGLGTEATYNEIVSFLDKHSYIPKQLSRLHTPFPSVYAPMNKTKILIYTGGTSDIGFGHIKRELELASYLQEKVSNITWTGIFDKRAQAQIEKKGFHITDKLSPETRFDGAIYDVTEDPYNFEYINPQTIRKLRQIANRVYYVSGGNIKEKHLFDRYFIPVSNKVMPYLPISNETRYCHIRTSPPSQIKKVLIYSGGWRKNNWVRKILEMLPSEIEKMVFLNPLYKQDFIEELKNQSTIYQNIPSICDVLEQVDAVICSYGNLCFESISLGIPTAIVALKQTQIPYARTVDNEGIASFIGHINDIKPHNIKAFIENTALWQKLFENSYKVDFWGIYRISQEILLDIHSNT